MLSFTCPASGASSVTAVAAALCLCSSMAFPWACYLVASRRCATKYRGKRAHALLDCCHGTLLLFSAAYLCCSISSLQGCLPSFLRGSGAGYSAALVAFGQTAFTPNAHSTTHDLLLMGQLVLLALNAFSGGAALLKGLFQVKDCLAARIGSIDCMHNLAFLSCNLFQALPTLGVLSIFFDLVCFKGCLTPVFQERGAGLASQTPGRIQKVDPLSVWAIWIRCPISGSATNFVYNS